MEKQILFVEDGSVMDCDLDEIRELGILPIIYRQGGNIPEFRTVNITEYENIQKEPIVNQVKEDLLAALSEFLFTNATSHDYYDNERREHIYKMVYNGTIIDFMDDFGKFLEEDKQQ